MDVASKCISGKDEVLVKEMESKDEAVAMEREGK